MPISLLLRKIHLVLPVMPLALLIKESGSIQRSQDEKTSHPGACPRRDAAPPNGSQEWPGDPSLIDGRPSRRCGSCPTSAVAEPYILTSLAVRCPAVKSRAGRESRDVDVCEIPSPNPNVSGYGPAVAPGSTAPAPSNAPLRRPDEGLARVMGGSSQNDGRRALTPSKCWGDCRSHVHAWCARGAKDPASSLHTAMGCRRMSYPASRCRRRWALTKPPMMWPRGTPFHDYLGAAPRPRTHAPLTSPSVLRHA
jgi:hypothetical protein